MAALLAEQRSATLGALGGHLGAWGLGVAALVLLRRRSLSLSEAERNAALARLEGERRLKATFENATAGIGMKALDGSLKEANQQLCELIGRPRDQVLGHRLDEFLHPDDAAVDAASRRELEAGRQTRWQRERRLVRPDGSEVWCVLSTAPIRGVDGALEGFVTVAEDITARRAAEAEVKRAQEELKQAQGIAETGSWRYEPSRNSATFSDEACRIFGLPPASSLMLEQFMNLVHPEDRDKVLQAWGRATRGEPYDVEHRVLVGGRERWVRERAEVRLSRSGEPLAGLGTVQDITAKRAAEAEVRAAKDVAESASRAKSHFLASVSHEIRTPLNGIMGMAQLMLGVPLDGPAQQAHARTIFSSAQTLLAILNDVLDTSRIEAGKLTLERKPFSPRRVLDDTAALFGETAKQKGLALTTRWRGTGPDRCLGDEVRLQQVVANLVINAIKFTPLGSVTIEGSMEPSGEGHRLTFAVTDTGIGIAEDKQRLLFQPFSQLNGTGAARQAGTGLGLSIARGLARLMGGDLEVSSREGQGTTFTVAVQVEAAGALEEAKVEVPLAPRSAAFPGLRVLVAEDVAINRRVIAGMLERLGATTTLVEDGRAAIEAVERAQAGRTFDLVLMDCQMPEVDGLEATRRLRAWERSGSRRHLPIVALTASAFQEDRERCTAAGMDDFLAKPLTLDALVTVLHRVCPGPVQKASA